MVGASLDVILELMFAAMLLPLSRLSLLIPWCDRVVASDAAPGGHGLAYTSLQPGDAQLWVRWATRLGEYVLLEDADRWLRIPAAGATPLHTVKSPLHRYFWHSVAKPAYVWSLTERLHRGERNCRCMHSGDNTAQGRSSTFLRNVRSRRALALQALGGITVFMLYVPSRANPSDRACRKYAKPSAGCSVG